MRGTPCGVPFGQHVLGIIPAYAGNTTYPYAFGNGSQGSSPRMRGTLAPVIIGHVAHGIIPAYAGNTETWNYAPPSPRDHPRVCGEHIEYKVEGATSQGSSPRMRGTRSRYRPCMRRTGIIPAYAGNTGRYVSRYAARWDHPRVCGEHLDNLEKLVKDAGSSPRMRGTLACWPVRCCSRRIIPAYAGNTHA